MPWPPRARRSARCASTPASWACWPARCATSSTSWAPPAPSIVVSGDLDEFSIAALRAEPVDSYGVGTSVVTGSGAPTASMVYKLVEVDGMPVQKRSSHKESHGGRKEALRLSRPDRHDHRGGGASGGPSARRTAEPFRVLTTAAGPRRRGGDRKPDLAAARELVVVRAAQPAVGGSEPIARRAGDPDDADPAVPSAPPVSKESNHVRRVRVRARAAGHRRGRARRQRTQRPAGRWPPRWRTPSRPVSISSCRPAPAPASRWPTWCPRSSRAISDESPVVVSTATIALQRQLVDRDLPRLVDSLCRCAAPPAALRAAQRVDGTTCA